MTSTGGPKKPGASAAEALRRWLRESAGPANRPLAIPEPKASGPARPPGEDLYGGFRLLEGRASPGPDGHVVIATDEKLFSREPGPTFDLGPESAMPEDLRLLVPELTAMRGSFGDRVLTAEGKARVRTLLGPDSPLEPGTQTVLRNALLTLALRYADDPAAKLAKAREQLEKADPRTPLEHQYGSQELWDMRHLADVGLLDVQVEPMKAVEYAKDYDTTAVPLRDALAAGLMPSGDLFVRTGLAARSFEAPSVEERVLLDPANVAECKKLILTALASLGPLTEWELMRVTGLSTELLGVFVDGFPHGRMPVEAHLLSTHPGVVTRLSDGRVALVTPDETVARQEALIEQVRGRLEEARVALADVRSLLSGGLEAPGLGPRGAELLEAVRSLYGHLQGMDLVAPDEELGRWLSQPRSGGERDERAWQAMAVVLASHIVRPLEKVFGYDGSTTGMLENHVAFEQDPLAKLHAALVPVFHSLIDTRSADLSNAQFCWSLGRPPNVGMSAAEVVSALRVVVETEAPPEPAIARGLGELESWSRGWGASHREADAHLVEGLRQAAELRAAREQGLATPADWARHLETEVVVPSKIFEVLERLHASGQIPVEPILEALHLAAATPQIAEEARRLLIARFAGDRKAEQTAAKNLLGFVSLKMIGAREYGDARVPNAKKTIVGFSAGGGPEKLCINTPGYVEASYDWQLLVALLKINDDMARNLRRVADLGTVMRPQNLDLLIDLGVARGLGDEGRFQELRAQVLGLHAEVCARCSTGQLQYDAFLDWFLSSPHVAMGRLEFMDCSRAADVTFQAVSVRVWTRVHQRPPSSPSEWEEALAFKTWPENRVPQDMEGLDFERLARYSLTYKTSRIDPADAPHLLVPPRPALAPFSVERTPLGLEIREAGRHAGAVTLEVVRKGTSFGVGGPGIVEASVPVEGVVRDVHPYRDAFGALRLRMVVSNGWDEVIHDIGLGASETSVLSRRKTSPEVRAVRGLLERVSITERAATSMLPHLGSFGNRARFLEYLDQIVQRLSRPEASFAGLPAQMDVERLGAAVAELKAWPSGGDEGFRERARTVVTAVGQWLEHNAEVRVPGSGSAVALFRNGQVERWTRPDTETDPR